MKNGILTIMKKELTRFFTDKRLIFTTIFMPGILIYIMYTFMGTALTNMYSPQEGYNEVLVVSLPGSVADMDEDYSLKFLRVNRDDTEQYKEMIAKGEKNLFVVFPMYFDDLVADYVAGTGDAPNVEIYYNSSSKGSSTAYQNMINLLNDYEYSISNKFDVNAGDGIYDLATEEDTAASLFASLMPMLLMIFLFSGCMAVAPESIAGEKERGTITTILITPIRRRDLAIGKIAALAIVALLSGVSSALGTILSFPKLMGGADFVAISIISAFAKTTKEAQSYVMPLMILVMAIGITAMFGNSASQNPAVYLIPFYNSVQCMVSVLSFEVVPTHILICALSNVFYTALGVWALAKMFDNERIIFSR